jgi:hypothetical protein
LISRFGFFEASRDTSRDCLVHVARAVGKLSINQKYFGRILATQNWRIVRPNFWEKYRRIQGEHQENAILAILRSVDSRGFKLKAKS